MKYTLNIKRSLQRPPHNTPPQACPDASCRAIAPERRIKLVLRAAPGEVAWHIALKILGYLLFMEYEPRIEEGIGWHYKPDLVSLDDHGALRLWVDCGNIAVRKIDRVAQKVGPDAPFVILRRSHRDALLLAQSLDKMRFPERVHILSFEKGFVDAFADALDATNQIQTRISLHPTSAPQSRMTADCAASSDVYPSVTHMAAIALQVSNRKGDSTLSSAITLQKP
ncbi:YaeQ family protein [Desulfovibrio mangrovi]|uniref:YaeQ family protein n=1 Tax=Desulfovibrio mangrovi TaxID=2976983 RepID=UPI0022465E83|nr:YaeQ family protein [Desulfovibrio mangrovi]UZP67030.1 YaeQ family protein [Desulfovibrio mangrovi]